MAQTHGFQEGWDVTSYKKAPRAALGLLTKADVRYACYTTGLTGSLKPSFPDYHTSSFNDAEAWYKRFDGKAFVVDTYTDKAVLGTDNRS